MDQLKEMGEFVRSASSTIEAPVVRRLKEAFSTKAADQPAQGNQGHQGSRPRPAGPAAPRDGAVPGGSRPRPGAGAVPAPQGARDDRAAAAAGTAAAPASAPAGTANGSAERAVAPDGAAAAATTSAPDAAASPLPPVPPSPAFPAGRAAAAGRSRRPAGARSAAHPGHPGRLPQPRRGPGAEQCPALGAASQRAGCWFRPASRWWPGEPSGSGRSGFQAVRAPAAGTWCPPSGGAQARCPWPAFRRPASWPQAW